MTPLDAARWQRIREIFDSASELDSAEQREFVNRACSGDEELRREVESLLGHSEDTGEIGHVVHRVMADHETTREPSRVGTQVGPYRILERIGAGGMGAVWLAERSDGAFRKNVALKIVRGGLDSPHLVQRFRAERQILARLEHPGIARILDGGETDDGLPYLVLEHVEGAAVDVFCDRQDLGPRDRLRLLRRVCDAVEYAHHQLVIHRDLKPANILVTADGEPKLLDFGIAKLTAEERDAGLTVAGSRPMTPEYAAPEQIRGEPVSMATDVYALGLLLYELLTGEHPFRRKEASLRELESAILETDPLPPSMAARRSTTASARSGGELPQDLDSIVLMALEKDPVKRYPTVTELAADIDRYLDGLPVRARPWTFPYRAGKFLRRHLVAVSLSTAVALALVVATIVSTTLFFRTQRAQREAVAQHRNAEEISTFLASMLASVNPELARGRDVTVLRELLDNTAGRIDAEFEGQDDVAATLRLTIGRTYRAIAAYDQAEQHLRSALETRRRMPATDEAIAEARHELGLLLSERSLFPEAESLLVAALDVRRESERPMEFVSTLRELARVRQARAHETAEGLWREAVDFTRREFGEESEEYAVSLKDLAGYLWYSEDRAGRREEARPLMDRAVAIWRHVESPSLMSFANTLHDAAIMRRDSNESAAADTLFREALAVKRGFLDPDHPEIAVTLNNLAGLREREGDLEQAESLYRETLRIQSALGGDHLSAGTTHNNLGGLLRKAGRYEESEQHFDEALRIYRSVLGPEHPWVAIVLGNVARLHEASGDCVRAIPVVEEFVRIAELGWAPDHARLAAVRSIRGACLARDGRFADAESVLVSAHEQILAGPDSGTSDARDSARRLVDLYDRWGKPERADPYRTLLDSGERR